MTRAFGFIRFIFLAYAISFYFRNYKKDFLKYWFLIFLIVTFDIFYESFFGKNTIDFHQIILEELLVLLGKN